MATIHLPAQVGIRSIDNGWVLSWTSGLTCEFDPPAGDEYFEDYRDAVERMQNLPAEKEE